MFGTHHVASMLQASAEAKTRLKDLDEDCAMSGLRGLDMAYSLYRSMSRLLLTTLQCVYSSPRTKSNLGNLTNNWKD